MRTFILLSLLLSSSACFFQDVPLEDRACSTDADCVDGFACVDDKCVSTGAPTDAGVVADAQEEES